MTQRERHASGGVSEAPRPGAGHPVLPRLGPSPELGLSRTPLWEDFFSAATPAQQVELLSLAGRQGVLYGHQLPPAGNGAASDRTRQFLSRLLNGQTKDLEPVQIEPVDLVDTVLDEVQREAVARALATPDLCLIQGLPGTGKSRVATEIVIQAAQRGERVLLLAPSTAAIDRVLEPAAGRDGVCAVRCLGRDDATAELPPGIAHLSFGERLRCLREHSSQGARREVELAEQRAQRRRQEESVWPRFQELAEQHAQLDHQAAELRRQRDQVPAEVERQVADQAPAGNLTVALEAAAKRQRYVLESIDHVLADLASQLTQRREEMSDLNTQIAALRPLADAKQHHRWWTGAFWRATFGEDAAARLDELSTREQKAQDGLDNLQAETERVTQQRAEAVAAAAAERSSLIEAEMARLQGELDERLAALQGEQQLLQNKWQVLCETLDSDRLRPESPTAAAIQEARERWSAQREREEQELAFAQEWAAGLEKVADSLPARLAGYVNLVGATLPTIAGDPQFGDASPHATSFDLLVLDEAHLVTESEFLNAARRARRWVLIGEPAWERVSAPAPERDNAPPEHRSRGSGSSRFRTPARPAALRPGFFQRLWQHLHCDPRQWPYAWVQEPDRLVCRLRPLPAEQRERLECERVADFPDIELRILALPRTEPALAEVVFPSAMSISQAKEYIFKELDELPVHAAGHSLRWSEQPDRLVLRLADAPAADLVPVALGQGVQEWVAAAAPEPNGDQPQTIPWHTCRLEFDRGAGWCRQRAEEWVRAHLRVCDLGRTVRLDVPHRMRPELAVFVADVLFPGGYAVSALPAALPPLPVNGGTGRHVCAAAVEFVAVPPLEKEPEPRGRGDTRRGHGGGRPRVNRGGAGLELDLTDQRHRDRLPSELRPLLPERGFVNYLEAQALVRTLEASLGAACVCTTLPAGACEERLPVGVMALYPSQVELLRRLIQQSPALAAAPWELKVDVPAAFRERECSAVFLSLTRSHTHRAVPYGEDPQQFALALTRARGRLVLFGDPGTLVRRSQWEGALDHLDEAAATRERELVAQLVQYLQGQGPHARVFQLREGKSK